MMTICTNTASAAKPTTVMIQVPPIPMNRPPSSAAPAMSTSAIIQFMPTASVSVA